ncbi:DUF3080 domain-containing protein [Pseudoalteromonas sp. 5-MNA-CIBAN-0065]|uniref:DUF3080 domain-containing protein n=1 Tax=Pseudoalteromonas sp. 5-MNA-CIBAN-0065 TaxID=3140421 RepID=UPI003325A7E3
MNRLCKLKRLLVKPLPIICLLVVCFIALTACSDKPSNANHTYIQRLANTLDLQPVTPKPLVPLSLIPLTVLSDSNITLGIIQLASLSHCKLNVLISEHNNQLGKTATAASILIYQIKFIQSAQQCLTSLEKDSSIYKKILAATEHKQNNLMHYFNSMLYKESELNRIWQLSSRELSITPAGFSDTVNAVTKLVNIKQQITKQQFAQINSEHLFAALEQLNKYQFNQQLIQSVRTQIALNNSATQFINTINISQLCQAGKNNNQAQIVNNIFKKYYLGQVQPYQAQLAGYLETLQPLYQQLWYKTAITSKPINNLLQPNANSNLLNQLKYSAKNHVLWWQVFYKTCEISPI